ncbi:hypothetical protein HUJ04_010803 [Dendroctonus ponderosae]|nr:hypothetical protein HUJ04_010803 [Dendroctonus ponderosae]
MNLLIHFTSNMFGCYDHYHTILETPISTSVTCTLQSTTAHRLSKRVKWDGIGGDSRRGSVRLLRQSKEMKYSSLSTTRSVIKLNYKIIKIRSIHINILCVPNKQEQYSFLPIIVNTKANEYFKKLLTASTYLHTNLQCPNNRMSLKRMPFVKEKDEIGEILENVLTYGPSRAAGCSGDSPTKTSFDNQSCTVARSIMNTAFGKHCQIFGKFKYVGNKTC